MNEAPWTKSTSKEEIFNQLCQAIRNMNEKVDKLTNIQNEKLDKLTNITQNLESKLNGMQKNIVEHENTLNQLEEKKEMVQKIKLVGFQLDRREQYIR